MKFKFDENFGQSVLEVFKRRGFDCHTVHDEGLVGAEDPDVLAAAVAEDRILVTLDRDFEPGRIREHRIDDDDEPA